MYKSSMKEVYKDIYTDNQTRLIIFIYIKVKLTG
jgi:hypothetical protein